MARSKKILIGAVNITIKSHDPMQYLSLFRDAYRLKQPIHIYGDQYALLAGMHKLDRQQEELGPITGDIFRYTDIRKDALWFNTETADFAKEDELTGVNIPENLKPNSVRFPYIFFPHEHIFFYEGYHDRHSLGASRVERFVAALLNDERLLEKYGTVNATHVPAVDELSEALRIPTKERITLMIKRPNPDDHADTERRVMERMNNTHTAVIEEVYKAVAGDSIQMDAEMEAMAHVAARNGRFTIRGKSADSSPIEFSTAEHPFREAAYYDPDVETAFSLFERLAISFKESIGEWFRR